MFLDECLVSVYRIGAERILYAWAQLLSMVVNNIVVLSICGRVWSSRLDLKELPFNGSMMEEPRHFVSICIGPLYVARARSEAHTRDVPSQWACVVRPPSRSVPLASSLTGPAPTPASSTSPLSIATVCAGRIGGWMWILSTASLPM